MKIRLDHILWGGEQGISANVYSRQTHNYLRSSTLLKDSPHVQLLRQYHEIGEKIFEPKTLKKTNYYKNIIECIQQCGNYFNIKDPKDAPSQIRRFIDHYKGIEKAPIYQQTDSGDPIVASNVFSAYYEVIDGIHRLAIAYAKGVEEIECIICERKTISYLQQLVLGNKWTPGQFLLYQPIEFPEFEKFTLVRKCSDRFAMMERYLKANLPDFNGKIYLDLGCSYGYFLARMQSLGMKVYGVDDCANSIMLAQICYKIPKGRLLGLSIENFFELNEERYDVVSLLSVLHHFLLKRGTISAEELIRKVDQITESVLFIDSGQNHEQWFQKSLPGWDEKKLVEWLKAHTTFNQISVLGADTDNIGIYSNNYGRTLIACSRK